MIPPKVALVAMPFALCRVPSIGLGILKGALLAAGLPSTIYHFNLDILPELGASATDALKACDLIASPHETLIGEWLFSRPDAARDTRYLACLQDKGFEPGEVALIRDLRPRLDKWIERWAQRIVRGGHDIVGFSCSIDRTRASVRLAEAIRAIAPGTRLIAGGFSATGDMGLAMLEAFDAFDLVCHAEGDEVIVPIVEALRGRPGASVEAIAGVSYRSEGRIVTQARGTPLADVERSPLPDFDDYFEQVERLRASWDPALDLPRALPLETARGCWWGARTPCTFCSLNGDRMTFRSKSPRRVLQDIADLHRKHGAKPFGVVDNILSDTFFDSLLPELSRQRPKKAFSWEVRPNLGREQAAALVRAGVVQVQPGIESLSTPALRLMRKGTSGIENVQALKWLSAYRIRCSWNFLFSLPGERVEWYEEVARLIPRLMHLPPPTGLRRISLQRFSPLFARAAEQQLTVTGPTVFTRLVFDDVRGDLLDRLSYSFDYEFAGRPPGLDSRIRELLEPPIHAWMGAYEAADCTLSLINGPVESLLIIGPAFQPERLLRVKGTMRRFLRGAESICAERRLVQALVDAAPGVQGGEPPLDAGAYRQVAAELCSFGVPLEDLPAVDIPDVVRFADERGWIYREAGQLLALPVDQTHLVRSGAFMFDVALRRRQPPSATP
jgi:ribosomal peptide maturation radical SAM protein 1